MTKSESVKNIASALCTFKLKVDRIKKDANNPFFKSKYASLSNILDAINDPLVESGLSFCQFPDGVNGLTTILMHKDSGEYIESTYEMKPVKDDPQGRGSVITYQRRYALAAILGLNIDEDDDANTGTFGNKQPEKVPAPKRDQQGNVVTAYNHNELGTKEKPLITNEQFKKLMSRIKTGDYEAGYKAKDAFSFEATQKTLFIQEMQKIVPDFKF